MLVGRKRAALRVGALDVAQFEGLLGVFVDPADAGRAGAGLAVFGNHRRTGAVEVHLESLRHDEADVARKQGGVQRAGAVGRRCQPPHVWTTSPPAPDRSTIRFLGKCSHQSRAAGMDPGVSSRPLVLVTGAFGNLGRSILRELLQEGYPVRAFDLPTPENRRFAAAAPSGVEACFGDLTNEADVARAVAGVGAVLHFAGILPPLSERRPELARAVNLEGTRLLVAAAERERADMPLVFASSCSVYGPWQGVRGIARADSPTEATDHYTTTKLAAEEILRESTLAWVILRVGAAIEGSGSAGDPIVLRLMFEVAPDNPIELIHGEDVARAAVRALAVPQVHRRVLPLGGGPSCRITQREMMLASFSAMGVGKLPESAFGRAPYYTSWLDSDEAQRLLDYQRADITRIRADLRTRFGTWRPFVRPVAPLVRYALLRFSGPHCGRPPLSTMRALIDAGY